MPARAKQEAEARPRDWSWVETTIWTERMLAALGNGVKGSKWFSLIDKVARADTLRLAWEQVARNRGAAGVDGQSVEKFAARAETYLDELEQALKQGRYRPMPVKRVEIPKGPGQTRPLGIPAVKDRIVQTALKRVIEPIFENEFHDTSYGFRPGRGCKDALREVDWHLKAGYTHVVDADLKSYFDSIPHDRLLTRVEERISDGRVLDLIRAYLSQDVMHGLERWTPTGGTPQGAVISPLLANLYLHPLDTLMAAKGYRMVRYADDFVVLSRTAEEAEAALVEVRAWVEANGLTLHPDKTRTGNCLDAGQGFDFLGYRFEAGRRWVRKKSLKAVKDKLRSKTGRKRGVSLKSIIEELNPILRGWFGYFKHAHRTVFKVLDGLIRRRLRALLRKREKRPGFGRCHADHSRWPNAFFAEQGLFTLVGAHAKASQSRC
ncbi:MAG: group II intron reverse transcriptase/maturase [Pseudomonadota bacterium]|nr:group II intron reverse transcriptase/maturase [Pseudomonadota bacterium]